MDLPPAPPPTAGFAPVLAMWRRVRSAVSSGTAPQGIPRVCRGGHGVGVLPKVKPGQHCLRQNRQRLERLKGACLWWQVLVPDVSLLALTAAGGGGGSEIRLCQTTLCSSLSPEGKRWREERKGNVPLYVFFDTLENPPLAVLRGD